MMFFVVRHKWLTIMSSGLAKLVVAGLYANLMEMVVMEYAACISLSQSTKNVAYACMLSVLCRLLSILYVLMYMFDKYLCFSLFQTKTWMVATFVTRLSQLRDLSSVTRQVSTSHKYVHYLCV